VKPVLIAVIVFAALPANLFVVLYHLTASWWKSQFGWNLMTLLASLALALDLSLSRWIFGPWPGLSHAALFVYFAIGCAVWWRLGLLLCAQLGDRSE